MKFRYHLVDSGQDLIFVDVDFFSTSGCEHIGKIVGLPTCCSSAYRSMLMEKPVSKRQNEVGKPFTFADPMKGFDVFELKHNISEIVEIKGNIMKTTKPGKHVQA